MNRRCHGGFLLLALTVALGCDDSPGSQPAPPDMAADASSRDAGGDADFGRDADAGDGGTRVPADASAGEADAGRDSGTQRDPCAGAVVLGGAEDVAAIAHCVEVGSLTVIGGLTKLELPLLQTVGGNLTVRGTGLVELDLAMLSVVGGFLVIEDNDALRAARMPSLLRVDGGYLHLTGRSLVSIDLSALQFAGGLLVASDADLHEVELPELEQVGDLSLGPTTATRIVLPKLASAYSVIAVHDNPLLASLELPALARVGWEWAGPRDSDGWGIFLEDNAQLTNVELPALQVVGETLSVQRDPMLSSLTLTSLQKVLGNLLLRDSALIDFSSPVLAKVGGSGIMAARQAWFWGDLTIADNALLQSIDLPSLTSVGHGVEISNNASLPTCDAQAVGAQLSEHPELPPEIDGNAGTCP